MGTTERRREPREQPPQAPGGGAGLGSDRAALRDAGSRLLDISHDIIERTLSGDSEAFLRASRQEGGE